MKVAVNVGSVAIAPFFNANSPVSFVNLAFAFLAFRQIVGRGLDLVAT
jgi:hypothetical protein